MVRRLVLGITLGAGLAAAVWGGASRCDFGVSRAVGKKVSCECGVIAVGQQKGLPPNSGKLERCASKFMGACARAKEAGDCSVQTVSCVAKEAEADSVTAALCLASPSGAFLN
jgi:hypothetical protein